MELDKILKRRTLRLKASLLENGRPKPSFLSTIYPAMDHGESAPHVVKTPASIPGFNDKEGEPDFEKEEPGKQVDEPGPSKGASFSQPAVPGMEASVTDAHKRAAFELGYFGEGRSQRFIKRCVELITGVTKIESNDDDADDVEIEPEDGGDGTAESKLSSIAKKFSEPKKSYG